MTLNLWEFITAGFLKFVTLNLWEFIKAGFLKSVTLNLWELYYTLFFLQESG